jgi:RIO kinase 1
MDQYEEIEAYLDLEEQFSSAGRANGKPSTKRKKKNTPSLAEMTDFVDSVAEWVPSYAAALDPKHHERQWLIESVASFYQNNVITDVTRRVKAGKEANVYCCLAHPATGVPFLAAKLYRPRTLRTMKNDAIYKAGRQLRNEEGKELKGRREKLALRQKTRFGQHLDMVWWIGNEFAVQKTLFEAGANVPRPFAHNGNTILMDYVGDESLPAPTLSDVALDREEAPELFGVVIDNVRLMLDNHFVHGDLSAFNILYWQGEIFIIDFPQVVGARNNPHAYTLLKRDIQRVSDYFARYGVRSNPEQLAREMWEPYMGVDS